MGTGEVRTGMTGLPPVLLLGIDTPIGLCVMRELGRHGVPVFGIGKTARSIGAASRYCTQFHVRGKGPLKDWLPALVEKTGAVALMAISEGDLIQLADMPEQIGPCRVLTPRKAALDLVLDKERTLALAREWGIETPVNYTGTPDRWPVVLKWADPMQVQPKLEAAGISFLKAEIVHSAAQLEKSLARYATLGIKPLVQSYASGRGLGRMFYRHKGETTLFFQHERLHEWPPEGGVSTLCQSLPASLHQQRKARSEAFLNKIGWEGPAMIEYRYDPVTKQFVLMEINGRFWGSLPLASAAGAEFGWEHYRRHILGETKDAPAWKAGIRARFMIPETRRLIKLFAARSAHVDPHARLRRWQSLWRWLSGFLDPKMHYYVFATDDPGPFFRDMANIIRSIVPLDKVFPADRVRHQSSESRPHNKLG